MGVFFWGVDVPVILFFFFFLNIYCPQSNLTMSRFVPVIMVCLDIKRKSFGNNTEFTIFVPFVKICNNFFFYCQCLFMLFKNLDINWMYLSGPLPYV